MPDAAPPYDLDGRRGGPAPVDQPSLSLAAPPAPATAPAIPVTSETSWARSFAQAIVEAVAGTRPFRQLVPVTTERVQARLKRLIPVLRTDGEVRIQRVLASRTGTDVVDVTVIAAFGPRTRALAMRFEQLPARPAAPGLPPRPARWLCTDVDTP